jgi:hypothetical protein
VRRSQNLVGKSCGFGCELMEEVVEELALRLPAPLGEDRGLRKSYRNQRR